MRTDAWMHLVFAVTLVGIAIGTVVAVLVSIAEQA